MKYQAVWRRRGIQTDGYPKLMVDDDVQSGSINVRGTRLPLWAIISTAINEGWDKVEWGWSPEANYGFTKEDLSHFLYCLLEQRGEFGRLLLLLANAEDKSECWWEKKSHRKRIVTQLKRCLNAVNQIDIT
jgi:hypothetical protein